MGDAVNLASRLEGITKQYGVGMIVGESTKETVTGIVFRELDQVRVKGKDEPVTIYEPIGAEGEVAPELQDEIKMFHKMLKMYRKQEWDDAELQLYNLQRMDQERKLYQVYMDRIAFFRKNPPPENWDGVFTYETK
jgi:adenylate cyclase